jgi:hypothetical protein
MPKTVFIVFGHPSTNSAEAEFLGAYSSEERAQHFIDAQPEARREMLSIYPVVLDEPHPDELWVKPGDSLSSRRQQDDARRAYRTVDTPAPIVQMLRHANMDPEHDHLNKLLEPDPLDPGACVCGHSFDEHHEGKLSREAR